MDLEIGGCLLINYDLEQLYCNMVDSRILVDQFGFGKSHGALVAPAGGSGDQVHLLVGLVTSTDLRNIC